MKAAVLAYTKLGAETAQKIAAVLARREELSDIYAAQSVSVYTIDRLWRPGFERIGNGGESFYGDLFRSADALIFVGACGIAVRCIAPFVRDKTADPAVIAVDEQARFVIPLLSGHIGGANALSRRLADALGAISVITTATDGRGRFSVDEWAAQNGCILSGLRAAKAISAAILDGDVPLASDFPICSALPAGVAAVPVWWEPSAIPAQRTSMPAHAVDSGADGIYVTFGVREPFQRTLRVIPRILHVGIGCRRGAAAESIAGAVDAVFAENGLDLRAVKCAASIDLKAAEPGLLAFCKDRKWPVSFYSAGELAGVAGEFTASDFVKSTTGVDNVCERAAIIGAARLRVPKTARGGVTVAVAEEKWEIHFG